MENAARDCGENSAGLFSPFSFEISVRDPRENYGPGGHPLPPFRSQKQLLFFLLIDELVQLCVLPMEGKLMEWYDALFIEVICRFFSVAY